MIRIDNDVEDAVSSSFHLARRVCLVARGRHRPETCLVPFPNMDADHG